MSVATALIASRPLAARRSVAPFLAALLLVATGWSVLAGGWTDGSGSVLIVGLAGVLEGFVLARSRVRRLVAVGLVPVLLLVSLLPTNAASRPAGPPGGVAHAVGQYVVAAVTGLLGNARWEFNVGLGAVLWICGAWAAWFAVRERRGAVATGPCWAVIAVNVINAPSSSAESLPSTLAAATALMLIAAVHLDRLNDGWQRRRVSVLPGTGGRFASAAAIGGAFIVLLALVVPPLSSTDISGRLFGGGSAPGGHNGQSGSGTGSNGATVRFNSATVPGGALSLSDTPVLTYAATPAAGEYLQMETDSVFDAGNFLPAESANNNGDDSEEIADPGLIPRDRSVADGGVGAGQATVSLNVRMIDDTSDTNTLPFAGEPDATSLATRVNGLTGAEVNNQLLTVDSVQSLRQLIGTSFSTTATQSTATAAQLRQAGSSYPALITRDFLDLTDDGSGGAAAIRALAQQWTRAAPTPYDKASAIEATLRNPQLFHYTLTPPTPPDPTKTWPVTYFLTTTHAGYCQYFAAAMGAMLRAVGIPARLVNGYGPGTAPNAATRGTTVEAVWNVSSNDAHTWVEAYFPGYGWIPFEPTPPSVAGDYQPFGRGAIGTARVPSGGGTPAPTPVAGAHTPIPQLATGANQGRSSGGRVVLMGFAGLLAAVLLVIALFAVWFLRPRDVRGVWRRVGIIGRVLGVPRDHALTFDEYVERLAAALPIHAQRSPSGRGGAGAAARTARLAEGLREIATISDRTFYAAPGALSDEARLRSAWRRVALLTPRLGRRATPASPTP